ncbi:RNA exonuclease 1 homolog [Orussus abietinus]|uniref:RNA exonuclease 1 homolog n=1 Tax=Orussus abietinus TaxID=222816 RepID=UPI00062533DD|nr:RNA exonuclease 1 homolog [Orussus abietinus]
MLPSTGYFKTINCPFYESGSCDRPYCHFKHARREDAAGLPAVAGSTSVQAVAGNKAGGSSTSGINSGPDMLQQLVSEAVKKVLAQQEVTNTEKFSETIVTKVVEELKPSLTSHSLASTSAASINSVVPSLIGKHIGVPPSVPKHTPCVYNPTPIAELKKRHIPVASYMPTRENRVAVKRKSSPERCKPWSTHTLQESDSPREAEITYKPTAISGSSDGSVIQGYVPTMKFDSSSPINSYDGSNSSDYSSKIKEAYYPKSKKRREEYVPRKVKAPLKNMEQFDDKILENFQSNYPMINDVIADSSSPYVPGSDDSEDGIVDIEPKFSDEEPIDDNADNNTGDDKPMEQEDINTSKSLEEKENKNDYIKAEIINEIVRDLKHKEKSDNTQKDGYKSVDRFNRGRHDSDNKHSHDHKNSDKKHKGKSKETSNSESKHDNEKSKRDHKSSKDCDKELKNKSHHERSSKEKHKHSSHGEKRERSSSSSKDKDKDKHKSSRSDKDNSNKTKHNSSSHKSTSLKEEQSNKDRHKSSSSEKHRHKSSSSSSKTGKHSLEKNSEERQSRSNHSSRNSSRKSKRRKSSSKERIITDQEDKSNSPWNSLSTFLDDDILAESESDHDVEEECLKIFQEYEVSDHPKEVKEPPKREVSQVIEDHGKKRVAHPSAETSVVRQVGPSQPPKRLTNPQQRMYERWRLMKEAAAEQVAKKADENATQVQGDLDTHVAPVSQNTAVNPTASSTKAPLATGNIKQTPQSENGRVRIAHVPYAMSIAVTKKRVPDSAPKVAEDNRTTAQTSKGGSRVAHVPQVVPQLVRPEPLQSSTQKFSLNVRQYYVNMMQDICMQIYTSGEDAAQRAIQEEFACYERCKAVAVYKSSCMLAAHRLRKEIDQRSNENSAPPSSGMMSHELVLAGKSRGSWSVVKTKRAVTDIKGTTLYMMLGKWILTEQQLRDNGYPRPHPDGPTGRAKVYVTNTRNQTILSKVPNERFCSRCGQTYMVDKTGMAVQQQNCIFHWGRKFTIRGEGKYSCCQQYGSASGCCDAKSHVWDYVDYENLRGYVKTLPKDGPDEKQGVYALDCEMCYTTQGLELTRVTVINEDCNVIYETLVKPENPIIDYNTRFSGITEENMKDVTTTILDVQATLLTMFSDKTVLVGHSLESDFKALKLIHETVVDTSVMFPHKNGYPHKRALKNLCSEYLRKIIQNDVGGHDSNEDAVACMELILWKVKEEAKV